MTRIMWMVGIVLVSCLLPNSNGFVPKTRTATTGTTTTKSLTLSSPNNNKNTNEKKNPRNGWSQGECWPQPHSQRRRRRGGSVRAWPHARDVDPKGMPPDYPLAMGRMAVTVGSVVWTWYASQRLNSAVMASSAVTLVASLISPGLGQAAMCGTFAGMSAPSLLTSTSSTTKLTASVAAVSLGLITSILFEALIHYRNVLLGIGGRLGLVAFLANNVMALLVTGHPLAAATTTATAAATSKSVAAAFPVTKAVTTSLYTALGAVLTIVLREASDDRSASDPVRASAVIGLVASLMVGVVIPIQYFNDASSLAIYAGSFVGMSLPSRLVHVKVKRIKTATGTTQSHTHTNTNTNTTNLALLSIFACAGAFGGFYNVALTHLGLWAVPAGWGGKAGFTSMLGVLTCRLLSKLLSNN